MPLTPEDVSNKRFTAVRLREGYDMTEVDQFLDEVETELTRLLRENEELRAEGGGAVRTTTAPGAGASADAAATTPASATTLTAAAGPETIKVSTTAEASSAAARLLELAATNADQVVAEAKTQAQQTREEAQSEAERLEADARTRAERLDAETSERREQLFGELERQKAELNAEIDRLRTFEREYRVELKGYFLAQLEALEGRSEGGLLGFREAGARGADAPSSQASSQGNGAAPTPASTPPPSS